MADQKISALSSASLPLAGTEVLPIVQSSATVKVAVDNLTVKNVRSNATTGILQIAGPGTGTTRVMTTPNANFTAARTDAAQTFTGDQTFSGQVLFTNSTGARPGSSGQYIIDAASGGFFQFTGSYLLVTTSGGSTSDANLKTNVQQLIGALDKVCAMRGVNFEFIEQPLSEPDQGTQLGVIAQEVEAQYPEIVVTDQNGIKSVRYDRLVVPLIEAVKELKTELDAAKAEIATLKAN